MAEENKKDQKTEHVRNKHLANINPDYLYHIGLNTSMNLHEKLGDVKIVLMSGTHERAKSFATKLKSEFKDDTSPLEVSCTERYHIYKAGPVLALSHGIGGPSMVLVLHEITKALHYAGAKDFSYIRIGTCGGVGAEPGTMVITEKVFDGALQESHEYTICGKKETRVPKFDEKLGKELLECGKRLDLPVLIGNTVTCDDFFESQGRVDGAICDFSDDDRIKFLNDCHAAGVRNIEMEGMMLGVFCAQLGIPNAMISTCLINRLKGDQVQSGLTAEKQAAIERAPGDLILELLRSRGILSKKRAREEDGTEEEHGREKK